MPSTYSSLKFELIATGEQPGTWGNTTNVNIGTAIEEAITGSATVTFTSGANTAIALTNTNAAQAARNLRLDLSGTMTTSQYLYVPAIEKFYIINNTLSNTVIVSNGSNAAATGTAVSIPSSTSVMLFNDGVNVTSVISHIPSLANVTITSGNVTVTNLTATTGNITTGNISTLTVTSNASIAGASITSGNATLTNLTATTGNITNANISSLTVTGNVTVSNVTVNSGNATFTNMTATRGNITTANISSLTVTSNATIAGASVTSGNATLTNLTATTGNITTGNISTLTVTTTATIAGASITSGNATLTNLTATTGNVTTGNIASLTVTSNASIAGASITSGNATFTNVTATRGNVTTGNIASLTVTSNATIAGASVTSGNATLTNLTATTANLTNANVTSVLTVAAGTNAAPSITFSGDTNTGIYSPAADTIAFTEGGVESMRIDSSGNLGLGVTPSAWGTASGQKAFQIGTSGFALSSSGAGAGDGSLTWNGYYNGTNWIYSYTGGAASRFRLNESGAAWFTAASGTAGNAITFTQAMTLGGLTDRTDLLLGATTSGDSTANRALLHINGTSTALIGLNTGGVRRGYLYTQGTDIIANSDTGSFTIQASGANLINFNTNGTERARITSGGEFLVGTTSTSFGTQGARMMTTGQIQAVSASGNDAFAGYRQTTTAGDSIITGYSNVGGTQVLKFNAMADGNVRIAAGATYGNISDQKYKTNIVDATPKLQDLMQLQVRNFNVSGSEQKAIGFIAQEFETVFPSLVIESVDKDFEGNDLGTTTKGIKESALIPILVKAIQELKAELDATKAEVAALKAQP